MAESAARLLRLLSLLQVRPHWTGPELAERLSVTERTLRRDIDRLRDLGYPVHADRGVTGGYRLAPGRALPPLLLDDDEAIALVVALRTAAGSGIAPPTLPGAGGAGSALSALAKLEQVLPTRLRPRIAALHQAMVALPAPAADPLVLAALATACRHQHRVRFGYTDFHGKPSSRHVEPLQLVYSGQHWYLVARDMDRDAWRVFRADRVTDPIDTAARFTLRDPPDATAVVAGAVATAPYAYQARVLLNMPAEQAVRRFPPNSSIVEARRPDRCVLTVGSDSLDAMALHLGVFDIELTVLEPAELRDRMRLIADRLRAMSGRSEPDASSVEK